MNQDAKPYVYKEIAYHYDDEVKVYDNYDMLFSVFITVCR